MVLYILALALVPLTLAGSMYPQQQTMSMFPQQKQWGSSGGYGVQMQGVIVPQMQQMQQMQHMQQQQQQQNDQQASNQWWSMNNQEEYEAYLKWCEERRMALQEQEQQQALLKEMEERYHEQQRAHEREKAAKELEVHEAAQWKMWKAQLEMADEFDGVMEKFMEMKTMYMFKLTTEFLKFCKCTDYASHLSRYLMYGKESYTPSVNDLFTIEGLQGINSTDVEVVARTLAGRSQTEQVKAFFGGAIDAMCNGMKGYVQQVVAWEAQYNFMGQ